MSSKSQQHKSVPVYSSEITPEHLYLSRRAFLKAAGFFGTAAVLARCTGQNQASPTETAVEAPSNASAGAKTDELDDALTSYEAITNYNNYYEFTTDKEDVASMAANFTTSPWQVEVTGLVDQPTTYTIEEIRDLFPSEERIYRLRCVEGWSMVIPWLGFSLSGLLEKVAPKPEAKFVRFESVLRPSEMPGQKVSYYPWPYQEGLRLDEAMNPLTILATGLYGKDLPKQDGAPLRLVVPWKYGFKSIKAIVKIELVTEQPSTLWSTIAPHEYGFYSNVNPDVPHPRWSQSSERRIGESGRRPTLPFNGYAEEVASMYEGMDLRENY